MFISYRVADSYATAALIDRELSSRFGSINVFLDSRSIPVGSDFAEELLTRLRACGVLLVVIGPRWLAIADENGRRCIDDPKDWVRREIVEALAHGIRVVPVLTDHAQLPSEADLPADIAELARRQYVSLRHRHVQVDLGYLVDRITEVEPASAIGDLDPERVRTKEELGELLHTVVLRAGRSHGDLEAWAVKKHGRTLAKSIISDVLEGRRLPSEAHLRLILYGCGVVDRATLDAWTRGRAEVARQERLPVLLADLLVERERELNECLEAYQRRIEELAGRELELKENLEREILKRDHLEEELGRLHEEIINERDKSQEFQRKLEELEALRGRECEHVNELHNELTVVIRERRHVQQDYDLALAERNDVSEATISLEDLADLHYLRAEFERREKEQLIRDLTQLRERVSQLERLLIHYQAEVNTHHGSTAKHEDTQ